MIAMIYISLVNISIQPSGSIGLHTGFHGVAVPVVPGSIPGEVNIETSFSILSGCLWYPRCCRFVLTLDSEQPMWCCLISYSLFSNRFNYKRKYFYLVL